MWVCFRFLFKLCHRIRECDCPVIQSSLHFDGTKKQMRLNAHPFSFFRWSVSYFCGAHFDIFINQSNYRVAVHPCLVCIFDNAMHMCAMTRLHRWVSTSVLSAVEVVRCLLSFRKVERGVTCQTLFGCLSEDFERKQHTTSSSSTPWQSHYQL